MFFNILIRIHIYKSVILYKINDYNIINYIYILFYYYYYYYFLILFLFVPILYIIFYSFQLYVYPHYF